jgi:hypothetical protein
MIDHIFWHHASADLPQVFGLQSQFNSIAKSLWEHRSAKSDMMQSVAKATSTSAMGS